MLKTQEMLLAELHEYANPKMKLFRMVQQGIYTPVVRGLYETDPATPGYLLAGAIYGPSYLSFDFVLSYYGMIPEAVYMYTSATFDKKKKKEYETPFGTFTFRDVPKGVYPYGVTLQEENGYTFQIATKEKALCDKLYTIPPVRSMKRMKKLLTEDLRIEDSDLKELQWNDIEKLSQKYHSTNVSLLLRCRREWE